MSLRSVKLPGLFLQNKKKSNQKLKNNQPNGAREARPIVFLFLYACLAILPKLSWQFHGAKRLFQLSWQFHGPKRLFLTILAASRSEAILF